MYVEKLELYHIHRSNYHNEAWRVGNSIQTPTENFNYFYDGIITAPHSKVLANLEEYDLIKYLDNNYDKFEKFNRVLISTDITEDFIFTLNEFNIHILHILNKTFDSLLYSRKALRELIFENVRQSKYPQLPSRQKCFWLCELNEIDIWRNDFRDNNEKSIFKVIATGNIFKTDGSHIQLDIFKLADFTKAADLYWKGERNLTVDSLPELVFEGNLQLVGEYNNPYEIHCGF